MRIIAIAFACMIALCSCFFAPYVPPGAGAPAAVLIVRNISPGPVTFWPYSNAANCTGLLDAEGLFNMSPGAQAQISIAAGQDFSLGASQEAGYAQATKSCAIDATFRPLAGKRYVATYRSDSRECFLRIDEEIQRGGMPQLIDDPSFRARRRMTGVATAYCE